MSDPAGDALPIDAVLDDLAAALGRGHAVLAAPPGSGKTTRVPLALREAPWLAGRKILMLEPRRPAARLAALRMASLLGEPPGASVGYQMRFERCLGPDTRIQVLTEGILTRRLQRDPALEDVGLLIFDEFHERTLTADLGLTLALDTVAALRPDLRLLIMSATLDTPAIAARLGGAPVIRAGGRAHPIAIHYAERPPGRDLAATVADGVRRALAEQGGDLLVFLPGAREIEQVRGLLEARAAPDLELLPLHGGLTTAEQDRALRPDGARRRRVVLATDIAETSVTIEGVTTVVDCGLTRKPRFDPGSGLARLVTEPIALASATQRAGRAGRLGPGTAYRLWTRAQEVGRPEHRPAEILQADLAPLALELALWGVRDPSDLQWLDPPPAPAWAQAVALLRDLGALDATGRLTRLGRRLAELPVHPRLARLLAAAPPAGRPLACDLAALLSDRDPWLAVPGEATPADLGLRLQALTAWRERRPTHGLDRRRLAAAARLSRELAGRLADAGSAEAPLADPIDAGALLALAYPDRIAQQRGADAARYRLAAGPGVRLSPDDPLARHRYLVVADLDAAGQDGRIRLALPIAEAELQTRLAERLETTETLRWDREREAVAARHETRLGTLVLAARPQPIGDPTAAAALLLEQVAARVDEALAWGERARQLQARVALLRRLEPEAGWPDLDDAALRTTVADWLGPWLVGRHRLADVRGLDLAEVLTARLAWPQRQRLDQEVPEWLTTPAGTRRRLDYGAGDVPVLAVPLQELFGAAATPTVAGGRVAVMLHLLSPARRPVQVTRDLAGFWARGYPEVRKELRGRYPKHHWPEDPTAAAPLAGGLKRRR
ncbi:ATP-dependent helicase HrpB [Thiococcus pfennigii]|uniref:ATP-dependent helicase HrpB n=1 Tax=Thiococcus pfennigii TaxID=1057 RepID=UPI0019076A73|nr:ATP-dependent helicase HrpB [Thiococcus pfennigii]MBK1733223.1 ATP-dependent helicase HrpB [Thiococcus pfennigii]